MDAKPKKIKIEPPLIKIGNEENSKNLFEKGVIYCNTRHYFASLKDGEKKRGDIYETALEVYNFKNLRLSKIIDTNEISGNLYCLYVYDNILSLNDFTPIKLNDVKLDDWVVFISNSVEFLNRLNKKFEEMLLSGEILGYHKGLVNYIDIAKKNGVLEYFDKSDEYRPQNELRYIINYPKNKELKFEIGSLEDVAIRMKVSEFINMRILTYDDDFLHEQRRLKGMPPL